jgi:hypothetical protein
MGRLKDAMPPTTELYSLSLSGYTVSVLWPALLG